MWGGGGGGIFTRNGGKPGMRELVGDAKFLKSLYIVDRGQGC